MKIFKIQVDNFRLLKEFTIDLEDELSLVIGKNNTGKTSILSVLEKFLNQSERNKFHFDDLNIDFKKEIECLIHGDFIEEDNYVAKGIKLKLFIEYTENCSLENVSRVMMDLDPDNKYIVLGFGYLLSFDKYKEIREDYQGFKTKEEAKKLINENYTPKTLYDFLRKSHADYFKLSKKSIEVDKEGNINELNTIDLDKEKISINDIVNFKYIGARREVANKEVDKTLSSQTSTIYEKMETSTDQNDAVDKFKDRLSETDEHLTGIYRSLFDEVIADVAKFGGIKPNESEIEIISNLQHRDLLKGNTTVVYKLDNDHKLPEHYNGLGYMNLISMIFDIKILIKEFKREKGRKPADVNLLFIEEPEAHTHPQMQYVFIKNIKKLLKDGIQRTDGENRNLQYIISTHSSHIVAESDFNDIKYLKKESTNKVVAKNLKDLESEYGESGEEQSFRFLKQYLTLNRAELFFAEKAIFIEGDTERILLPAMMKKVDQEDPQNPLLSQNISIVEVGAHSHIYEKFIDFIGLQKGLIITDIDSYYKTPDMEQDRTTQKKYKNGNPKFEEVPCAANNEKAQYTKNSSLIFFHRNNIDINYYKNLSFEQKIRRKRKNKKWVSNRRGNLFVCFQTIENDYWARSFEDAFFELNKGFIIDEKNKFESLINKWLVKYKNGNIESFDFAQKGVEKKPSLAIEILINSQDDDHGNLFSNWQIPGYIKEGLLWLKKD